MTPGSRVSPLIRALRTILIPDCRFLGDQEVIAPQKMVGRLQRSKVREGSGGSAYLPLSSVTFLQRPCGSSHPALHEPQCSFDVVFLSYVGFDRDIRFSFIPSTSCSCSVHVKYEHNVAPVCIFRLWLSSLHANTVACLAQYSGATMGPLKSPQDLRGPDLAPVLPS